MQLVTFETDIHNTSRGGPRWGRIDREGPDSAVVVDLRSVAPSVRALLDEGLDVSALVEAAGDRYPLDSVALLPPVLPARRIFCVGVNYHDHRDEIGARPVEHPTIFVRFADSVVGSGRPLLRPPESTRYDYEGELAVVIGKPGRRIRPENALSHVAGYSAFNDGSIRDFQRHTTQFTPGKNFDGSGAFGPWLVTADELPDPSALSLTTRVNGNVVQSATTDLMIFDVPTVIGYLSTFTELQPGDVIATGTPGGVGDKREPPLYLGAGDVVEVAISDIGTLTNTVADDSLVAR